jgi:PIN domain nuclease of toxin-antitoxin system
MILLDTCVLLWLASDQTKLSEIAKQHIARHTGSLYVSAISAFEIGIKVEKKKLELPKESLEWFNLALKLHGIIEIPLNSAQLIKSAQLPAYHNDPADRIIIAVSQLTQFQLITPDEHIKQYIDIIW